MLQNPKLDPLPLARDLYKILVEPVAADLKAANAQTLMWSLDGALRYLPMAALHDGQKYLVENYRITVFTPASQARLKDIPGEHWRALGLGVTKSHGERTPALPGVLQEMNSIIREDAARKILPPARGYCPAPSGSTRIHSDFDARWVEAASITGSYRQPLSIPARQRNQFRTAPR
ncbi:MAG: CHAT domain-containing protein [Acidobacteria bacterium]|nr:CHAT domain-containing protein [Acidobacteriota bacterium]